MRINGGGGSSCSSNTGLTTITGTARVDTTGNYNRGIYLHTAALSGVGLTLTGMGGGGSSYNEGIGMQGGSAVADATSGAVTILATGGGSGSGSGNNGFYSYGGLFGGDSVDITGNGGVGTGGNNHGAILYAIKTIGGTAVTSATPGFTVAGTAGDGATSKNTLGNYFVPAP